MKIEEVKNRMITRYKEGKGFNEGGLSFVAKGQGWDGMLVGVFINMKLGLDPETFEIKKTQF